ncbi:MAG: cyclic nucleotide-binding domain-containing protein [Deltaproteobacteria bacterium]|nr:cyclic nucleotide-binding domain-containing protein [Deltaproteobacteria bacterium]
MFSILSTEMVKVRFQKGQTIFYRGHLPYGIYIFSSGKVGLVTGEKGVEQVGAPNNVCIGLDSILADEVLPFTAVAQSDVIGYFVCKAAVQKYLCHFSSGQIERVQ